ncbi:MAG TPA: nucleoside triphosphate pyrophosphohydrolase [Saprospiraceae bacterium]|nr:nucleoside triphosphate pyrophosphohydrolase [Saprospiraceae bacterium]
MSHDLAKEKFRELLSVMDDLREKCPWDQKQTWQSLRNLTIEEVYELLDAISEGDSGHIKEEIGDVMLHLLFYTRLASETNLFSMTQVIESLIDKLKQRHPHIYGDVKVADEKEVRKNWEEIKKKKSGKSLLSGVPNSLPAMIKSWRLQEKAAQVGFEWDQIDQVWMKVEEELEELQSAKKSQASQEKLEDEWGDVVFALINYARFLGIDPEQSLQKTNAKFIRRFNFIESNASKPLQDMTLGEMDALWNSAKLNGL